jgi:hypothetical protein
VKHITFYYLDTVGTRWVTLNKPRAKQLLAFPALKTLDLNDIRLEMKSEDDARAEAEQQLFQTFDLGNFMSKLPSIKINHAIPFNQQQLSAHEV